MATVRNSRGLRDYGVLGPRYTVTTNDVLNRAKAAVRPTIAKEPLQPRKLPDVRKAPISSRPALQEIKAGKRNGPT